MVFTGFQPGNGGHDFVGDLLIDFLEPRFGTGLSFGPERGKIHWPAVLQCDGVWSRKANVTAPGFVGAEDAARNNGRIGFDDGEADARAGGLEFPVTRPGAFRKENDGSAVVQAVKNGLEPGCAAAITVNGHGVHRSQYPTDNGKFEKRFSGEVVDVAA